MPAAASPGCPRFWPNIAAGELVAVLPRWHIPTGAAWLVHPAARNRPAKLVAFRDFMIDALARRRPARSSAMR